MKEKNIENIEEFAEILKYLEDVEYFFSWEHRQILDNAKTILIDLFDEDNIHTTESNKKY